MTTRTDHAGWIDRGLLAVLIVVTFARGLFTPLQRSWDDGRFILDNALVHSIRWEHFVSIVSARHFEAYHPLHLLSYWLDVPWFGDNALPIHITSLLLWVIASFCVLSAMRALGLSRTSAWIATALCMVHPVQVEAVTWATGRKDVLALLFSALTITWHVRSQRFNDRAAWITRLMFLFAALSKTSVAALPLFLILIDLGRARRTWKQAITQQLPALLLMLGLGSFTVITWAASQMLRTENANEPTLFWRWAATLTHHLLTALWPSSNAAMYPSHGWATPGVRALLAPVLLLIGGVAWWRNPRLRLAAVGWIGFALLLLPESNLLPMVFPLQDRYACLPLLSLGLCAGALVDSFATKPNRGVLTRALALPLLCVLSLGARSVQYQGAWKAELSLWQHATSVQPRAYYAWMKLGEVRRDANDLHGAVDAYTRMVSLVPEIELGHVALFHALVLLDEHDNRLQSTPPMSLARRFGIGMRDAVQMHQLSQQLIAGGYDEAAAMALDYALTLKPFPSSVLAQNAARFERQQRTQLAAVLRRHEKQSAQRP